MKKIFLATAIIAVIVMGCGSTAPATGADELDSAIREASDYLNGNVPEGNKIVILNIQSSSADLSDYVIDELIANAVNDKIFSVVDRQQLDAIRAEQNFQYSGEVDDNAALEIGKFLGAQTIVSGAVSALGNGYRMRIRALDVLTAQVQGQFNRNIAAGSTINMLMASGASRSTGGSGGTATATGGRSGSSGSGTASGSGSGSGTQTATPAAPARRGYWEGNTYFFNPRLQVTQAGVRQNLYIDRVVVAGQYFSIFFTGGPTGRAGDGEYGYFWRELQKISLENLDSTGRPFNPINKGEDDDRNDPTATGGFYLMFQGVTGTRFSLTSAAVIPPWSFDEIILGEH